MQATMKNLTQNLAITSWMHPEELEYFQIREKRLIFYYNNAWPQYKFGDGKFGQKIEVLTIIPYYYQTCFAEEKANGLRVPLYRPS